MYQALYRKYRPKTFGEVVGQKVIIRTLENEILKEKLSHAYLFCGPRGTGKTSVAKIFAGIVNCENLVGTKVCNKCVSCTQKNNIDIIEIDAASHTGVDEIRELKSRINLVPTFGKYKVYIIDEVHMLSNGAFNALLKTLEEPPKHAIFILATTDPHKIPKTILSRCQRFDFKKISNTAICEKLKEISKIEKITIGDKTIEEIAIASDGGLRDAIGLLDQLTAYADDEITLDDVYEVNGTISKKELETFTTNLFTGNIKETFKFIEEKNEEGKNIIKLTEEILLYFRNKLINNLGIENDSEIISQEKISNEKLIHMIQIFNKEIKTMKESNDPKLVLELLCIKNLETNNPVDKQQKEIISQEIKTIQKIDDNYINFKEKRICNTLSGFDKKELLEIKKIVNNLDKSDYTVEENKILSLIEDGELKASGNDYLLYVYKNESMSKIFNKNIVFVESLINKMLNKDYKVISVCNNEWEIIKEDFNNKKKKYEYIEEDIKVYDLFKLNEEETEDELFDLFGKIVETN